MRTSLRVVLAVSVAFVLAGYEPAGLGANAQEAFSSSIDAGETRIIRVRLDAAQLEPDESFTTTLSASVDDVNVDVDVVQRSGGCREGVRCSVDYDVTLAAAVDADVIVSLDARVLAVMAHAGCGTEPPTLTIAFPDGPPQD